MISTHVGKCEEGTMKKRNEPMKYFAAIGLLGLMVLVPSWAQSLSDKRQETASESDPSALQALIKKMENDRIQAGVHKDVDAIAAVS
jgi:hypothetical protein